MSDPLLQLIKEKGLLDDMQFEEVMSEHTRTGKPVSEVLVNFGFVDTGTQLQLMAFAHVVALAGGTDRDARRVGCARVPAEPGVERFWRHRIFGDLALPYSL